MLLASVVFCATTFADESLFEGIGVGSGSGRLWLGFASVAAFAASLLMLVFDWKGTAARHEDAAGRWSDVVATFRRYQGGEGGWPSERGEELHYAYWNAAKNSVAIPDGKFNALKVKYLLKVEISRRAESHPGSLRFLLWLLVRISGTAKAIREEARTDREGGRDEQSSEQSTD
jgi:hypothetical protein